jgi:hypothetical protein
MTQTTSYLSGLLDRADTLREREFTVRDEPLPFGGPDAAAPVRIELPSHIEEARANLREAIERAEQARRDALYAETSIPDRLKQAAVSFTKGVNSMAAGTIKGVSVFAKAMQDSVDEYVLDLPDEWDADVKDYALYRAGQAMQDAAEKYLPDDPAIAGRFWFDVLPRGAGSMAAFVAGGAVSAAAKGSVAAATAAMGASSSASEGYDRAIRAGATEEEAIVSAELNGLVGLSEAAPITRLFGRFNRASNGRLSRGIGTILAEGGKQSVEEATQEFFQTAAGNQIAQDIGGEDPKLAENVWQAAGAGGLLGAIGGTVATGLGGRRADRDPMGLAEQLEDQGTQAPLDRDPTGLAAQADQQRAEPSFQFAGVAVTRQQAEALTKKQVPSRKDVEQIDPQLTKPGGAARTTPQRTALAESLKNQLQEADRAAEIREAEGVVHETGLQRQEGEGTGGQDVQLSEEAGRSAVAPREAEEGVSPVVERDRSPTSIKNAVVDQEREKRGLPPAMQPSRRAFGPVWEEAMALVEREPSTQDVLIAELSDNPRPISDLEDALLLHRQIGLQAQYDTTIQELSDAQQSGNTARVAEVRPLADMLSLELLNLYDINKAVGTANSRGLNARKMMANEDFTLVRMMYMKRDALDVDRLTNDELQVVQKSNARIASLEKQLDEHRQRLEAMEAEKALEDRLSATEKSVKAKRTKRASAAREDVDAAWKDFESILSGRLFANPLDPELVASATNLARAYVRLGVAKIADFLQQVAARIGSERASKVEDAMRSAWTTAIAEEVPKATQKALDGEAGSISRFAQRLAEFFLSGGITSRDELVNAVHTELVKAIPGLTRRQTMDAISGYGQFQALSKDEIKAQLRDLKGQMQQVAKLEDMQKGRAPLKTGPERRRPSDEERRLVAQVNAMKRAGGFTVTDPERQLRTALDAVKTRLRNQISDLEEQITTRERIVRTRKETTLDKEAQALIGRRDRLRQQFDEIFGVREMTDAQRVRNALTAVKRSIEEYQRRITDRDVDPKPRTSKTPITEELAALRAERDALKEEFKTLKDTINPKKTPEERALAALKANMRRRISDYQDRLARRDFEPKPKKTTVLDKEGERLRFEAEKARVDFIRELDRDRRARRTRLQKILGGVPETLNTSRAIITSIDFSAVLRQGGIVVVGHPVIGAKALGDMFSSFASEAGASKARAALEDRANAALYKRAKLALTDPHGKLSQQEEVYMARWSKAIPLVAASERAYVAFLNKIRADLFDSLYASLAKSGNANEATAKIVAAYVNVATGRGDLGKFQAAAVPLATTFFAPRYVASRFQWLFGQPLLHGTSATRFLIAREYARSLTGFGLAMSSAATALYALAGPPGEDKAWNVELDPRSSDFIKIRIGNSRIDFLAGLQQVTVLVSRVGSGKMKRLSGDVVPIRGDDVPYGSPTTAGIIGRFFRSKLSPWVSTALNYVTGENVIGEPFGIRDVPRDMLVPLSIRQIYDSMKEHGVPAGSALGILEVFGAAVQTHEDRNKARDLIGQFQGSGAQTQEDFRNAFRATWRRKGYKVGSSAYKKAWRTFSEELAKPAPRWNPMTGMEQADGSTSVPR